VGTLRKEDEDDIQLLSFIKRKRGGDAGFCNRNDTSEEGKEGFRPDSSIGATRKGRVLR